jgi:hypothetical protein
MYAGACNGIRHGVFTTEDLVEILPHPCTCVVAKGTEHSEKAKRSARSKRASRFERSVVRRVRGIRLGHPECSVHSCSDARARMEQYFD